MNSKENQELFSFNQFKYIKDIFECEKLKYILEKRKNNLINQKNKIYQSPRFEDTEFYENWCKEYKYPKKHLPEKNPPEKFVGFGAFIGFAFSGIIPLIIIFSNISKLKDGPELTLTFLIPIIGAIIGGILASHSYKKELEEYNVYLNANNKIDKDNKRTEMYHKNRYYFWLKEFEKSENERIKKLETTELVLINTENKQIDEKYIKVTGTLDMLYSLRLNGKLCLHPKYQGLFPISIIYGYFDTGRCDKLEGHEGAYNLYEDERFKQEIKDSIDYLSMKIDNLNGTMIYVGKAVEECNEKLLSLEENGQKMIAAVNKVDKSISNVSNQIEIIEENSTNSAYYSEIGAEMATFSTYYNLLKN